MEMMIWTLWHEGDDGDPPWITDAVDELTLDNNGFSPGYEEKLKDRYVRQLIIDVPEKEIRALFETPATKATVLDEEAKP